MLVSPGRLGRVGATNTQRSGRAAARNIVWAGDSGVAGTSNVELTGGWGVGRPDSVTLASAGNPWNSIRELIYANDDPDAVYVLFDMGLNEAQYTSLAEYIGWFEDIVAFIRHLRWLVLPPTVRANMSAQERADAATLATYYATNYPDNFVDWRDYLAVDGSGYVDPSLLKDLTHLYQTPNLALLNGIIDDYLVDRNWVDAYTPSGNLIDFLGGTLGGDNIVYSDGKIVVTPDSSARNVTWDVFATAASYDCRVVVEDRSAGNVNRRFVAGGTVSGSAVTADGDTTQTLVAVNNTTYQLTFAATSNLTVSLASVIPTA